MNAKSNLAALMTAAFCAFALVSCSPTVHIGGDQGPTTTMADKPFTSGGKIEMQLDGGDFTIRPAADDRVRIGFSGNVGSAKAELTVNGTQATLAVRDTPHNNFHATLEVPKVADLLIRIKGGNVEMSAITGNKDFESGAGNAEIAVGNANDYSHADASVKVGNLDAGPFGESQGGLAPHLTWSGPGKYTLHATLGAGNLELK